MWGSSEPEKGGDPASMQWETGQALRTEEETCKKAKEQERTSTRRRSRGVQKVGAVTCGEAWRLESHQHPPCKKCPGQLLARGGEGDREGRQGGWDSLSSARSGDAGVLSGCSRDVEQGQV